MCRKTLYLPILSLLCMIAMATPAAAGNNVEGTWVVNVDLNAPPPFLPESFTALETYCRGGGMTTSNDMTQQLPGGQGSWTRDGGDAEVTILFFTRDANGVANGTIKVRHTVTLIGSDTYSGTGVAEVRNLDGLLLGSVSFTSEGTRLE
jgi:hypothetical protein